MAPVYPLLAWGDPQNIASGTGWSTVTDPLVITSGVADPFGGTGAYTLEDNGATFEARTLTITAPVGIVLSVAVFAREGTAAAFLLQVGDTTAGVTRHTIRYTWTAGVPIPVTSFGDGRFASAIAVGGGWYLCLLDATGIVAGNSHRLNLFPAAPLASDTGTTSFYVRNVIVPGVPDAPLIYDEPGDGYETVRNDAGTEDAWTPSTSYQIGFDARFGYTRLLDNPQITSPYDGVIPANGAGVNCSMSALLRAGRDKVPLLYVPDRSVCSSFISSYLAAPLGGAPELEPDGSRRVRLLLRNASTAYEAYR